jgi:undecaprenyl-diphosphatase
VTSRTAEPATRVPTRVRRLVRAVLAMVAFLVPVLLLAYAVREKWDPLIDADNRAIVAATDWTRSHQAVQALLALQSWTQPWKVYIVGSAVALWVWLRKGMRGRALWAFVTMMVAWNLGLDAKLIVRRARPVVAEPVSHAPGYSFPSGHAFNITVVTTVMILLLWPLMSTVVRRVATVGAVMLCVAVGLDRIYLGVHYPSDVLAGLFLGLGVTYCSWIGFIAETAATSSPGSSPPA